MIVRFWPCCVSLFILCLNFQWMQLLLVPYSFFVFYCWRIYLSRFKHPPVKGPRSHLASEPSNMLSIVGIRFLMWMRRVTNIYMI